MNIHDISRRTHIAIGTLRKLERLGVLMVDDEDDAAPAIRLHLGRNQQMSVAHLLALLDTPALVDDLGRYVDRAKGQIAALGDVKATAAPREVTAEIPEAAKGNPAALRTLGEWVKSILPASDPASYHWLAVRLLFPLNEFLREQNSPLVNLALLKLRQAPEFAGWSRSVPRGGKTTTIFSRPANFPLDL